MPASLGGLKEYLRPKLTRNSRGSENLLKTVGRAAADFKDLWTTKKVAISAVNTFVRKRPEVDPWAGPALR
jgi:hypothetical protein